MVSRKIPSHCHVFLPGSPWDSSGDHRKGEEKTTRPHNIVWNIGCEEEDHCSHQSLSKDDTAAPLFSKPSFQSLRFLKLQRTGDYWFSTTPAGLIIYFCHLLTFSHCRWSFQLKGGRKTSTRKDPDEFPKLLWCWGRFHGWQWVDIGLTTQKWTLFKTWHFSHIKIFCSFYFVMHYIFVFCPLGNRCRWVNNYLSDVDSSSYLGLPRSRRLPKNYQDNAILTAFQDSGTNIAKRQKAQNDKVVR